MGNRSSAKCTRISIRGDAEAHATDTDKVMFWVAYGFGVKP